jgi:hypothetical protein
MAKLDLRALRESLTIALIAVLVGLAVYSMLGFAWTFKAAVEAGQKVKRLI